MKVTFLVKTAKKVVVDLDNEEVELIDKWPDEIYYKVIDAHRECKDTGYISDVDCELVETDEEYEERLARMAKLEADLPF